MAKKNQDDEVDPVIAELDAIKRLLIVGLLRDGVKQGHIATALGISDANLSRKLNGVGKLLAKDNAAKSKEE